MLSGYGKPASTAGSSLPATTEFGTNQLEKQAVIAARLRFFSITSSSLTGEEASMLILSALEKMSRLCRTGNEGLVDLTGIEPVTS